MEDLQAVFDECWSLLIRGATGERMALRTPVLATVTPEGLPNARTVILASVERFTRRVRIDTDRRSPKFAELSRCSCACLVAYDPDLEVQIRLSLQVRLCCDDELTRRHWATLAETGRALYAGAQPPGAPLSLPGSGLPEGMDPLRPGPAAEAGQANFAVIDALVTHMDWLHFAASGNRRAGFTWEPDQNLRATWLQP